MFVSTNSTTHLHIGVRKQNPKSSRWSSCFPVWSWAFGFGPCFAQVDEPLLWRAPSSRLNIRTRCMLCYVYIYTLYIFLISIITFYKQTSVCIYIYTPCVFCKFTLFIIIVIMINSYYCKYYYYHYHYYFYCYYCYSCYHCIIVLLLLL